MAHQMIKFVRDRGAAAGAEFALIVVVFAGLLLGIIDFGRALWEYNEAQKACQVGARFAVVNNMVAPGLHAWDGMNDGGLAEGQSIPLNAITPNPVVCDSAGCNGGFGYDSNAYNAIYDAMAAHYPRLGSSGTPNPNADVQVSYTNVGRCFAGRNLVGPDYCPLVTVSIQGLQFDFSTPLIGGFFPFEFPRCSASLVGEDYQTCSDGVSQPPCL
jgi:Flp pilus assembly protein TadG